MHLSTCGSSLVSYACYTNDLHSIFELDLPWTKSCLASILFTRIYKGFEPFPEYWRRDGDEADGNFLVEYLRRCLGGTGKIKARIRQLLTCEEKGSEEGVREGAKNDKEETKNDKEIKTEPKTPTEEPLLITGVRILPGSIARLRSRLAVMQEQQEKAGGCRARV